MHRELASGLSMPVGFKNGTGGDYQVAIDAVRATRQPHWFPSVTKQGVAAIFSTAGNPDGHVILRGGGHRGPNYAASDVAEVSGALRKAKLPPYLMVDCSHANSAKDYRNQPGVARALAEQIAAGERALCGVMMESFLVEGRQDWTSAAEAVYGQSITDACMSLEETEPLLLELAQAVSARRKRSREAPGALAAAGS